MSWTHIKDKDVRARKPHKCWLCAEPIDKGRTYRRRVGIGDDGPMTMHMHPECEAATRDWDQMDWEVTYFGDLDRPLPVTQCGDECRSCQGYGYFDEDDQPTIDKRGRKCGDCRGVG